MTTGLFFMFRLIKNLHTVNAINTNIRTKKCDYCTLPLDNLQGKHSIYKQNVFFNLSYSLFLGFKCYTINIYTSFKSIIN